MRNPDRLYPVLHALLEPPVRADLLADPELLATYLCDDWPEEDPEANGPWYTAGEYAEPGSQEASEFAELPCRVEEQLANLTPEQLQALGKAVEAVCPEALETFSLLTFIPSSIYMRPPEVNVCAADHPPSEPYRFTASPAHRARAALARQQIKTLPELLRQRHEESGPKGVARQLRIRTEQLQEINRPW